MQVTTFATDHAKQAILAEARSHFANADIPEILREYTL